MQVLQIHGIPRRKNEVEILQSFPEPEAFLYNEHTKQVEAWTIAVGLSVATPGVKSWANRLTARFKG